MNVGKSLDAIRDGAPPPRYEAPSEDSGNGSLMRLAPVPIAFAGRIDEAMMVPDGWVPPVRSPAMKVFFRLFNVFFGV